MPYIRRKEREKRKRERGGEHVYLPAAWARAACVQNMKHFLWGKTASTVDHRLPLDCTWRQWHSIVCHRIAPERKKERERGRTSMSKRIRHGFFNKSSGVIFELRASRWAELSCCGEARQGELFPVMLAIYFCFCFSYCCCCSCFSFYCSYCNCCCCCSRLYVTYMISSSSSRAKAPDMARRGSTYIVYTHAHIILYIYIYNI